MIIEFLPGAEAELLQAISYYDEQLPGLGDRFDHQFWETIEKIAANPSAWTPVGEQARKCNLRDFPYGVVYRERADQLVVVAVMNLHRRPDYWKSRL